MQRILGCDSLSRWLNWPYLASHRSQFRLNGNTQTKRRFQLLLCRWRYISLEGGKLYFWILQNKKQACIGSLRLWGLLNYCLCKCSLSLFSAREVNTNYSQQYWPSLQVWDYLGRSWTTRNSRGSQEQEDQWRRSCEQLICKSCRRLVALCLNFKRVCPCSWRCRYWACRMELSRCTQVRKAGRLILGGLAPDRVVGTILLACIRVRS